MVFAWIVLHGSQAQAETPQLQFSQARMHFGTVAVGQSETQLVTLTNTGSTSASVSAISVDDSEFSVSSMNLPLALAAGQSVNLNVVFTPSATGWVGAEVTVSSNASNPNLKLVLGGTGAATDPLTAAPSSLSFGNVKVGSSTTLSVVVTNPKTWNQTLTAFTTTGSEFTVTGPSLPLTLAPGKTVTLTVTFSPTAAGTAGGSVFITAPGLNVPFTGTGTTIGQLSLTPASLSFGNVNLGSSTTETSTLTATGGNVTVSSGTSSNSQFTISGTSFPLTISAGQSAAVSVVFTPTQTGTDSATLKFLSNASDSQDSESLSGVGVAPQYSVNLSWTASTSTVAGYNVYRGTTAGSYSKINSTLDPNTAYTDSTVAANTTYYYAATSVTSSGEESGYSKAIEVTIP